jgi:hypothetical protein
MQYRRVGKWGLKLPEISSAAVDRERLHRRNFVCGSSSAGPP